MVSALKVDGYRIKLDDLGAGDSTSHSTGGEVLPLGRVLQTVEKVVPNLGVVSLLSAD